MKWEGKRSRYLREELPGRVNSYPEPGRCAQKAAEAGRQWKACFWGRSLDFILSAMGSQSRQVTESDFFFLFKCLNTPLGMQDLSSQPGIEPMPPVVEAQTPNSCTAREVLSLASLWKVGCGGVGLEACRGDSWSSQGEQGWWTGLGGSRRSSDKWAGLAYIWKVELMGPAGGLMWDVREGVKDAFKDFSLRDQMNGAVMHWNGKPQGRIRCRGGGWGDNKAWFGKC